MLDWAKAIHEAIGIESPKLFIAVFALIGLLLFAFVGWIIDRGYRIKLSQPHADHAVQLTTLREEQSSNIPQAPEPVNAPMSTASPAVEAVGRIFVPDGIDTKFLTSLYDNKTSMQAQALTTFYIGKWMKLVAPVEDVFIHGDTIFVMLVFTLDTPLPIITTLGFEVAQWGARVSMLTPGLMIMAMGEIEQIETRRLRLKRCELI